MSSKIKIKISKKDRYEDLLAHVETLKNDVNKKLTGIIAKIEAIMEMEEK